MPKQGKAKPSYEELQARIEELESKKNGNAPLTFKVGVKGGVSVYGLGRFPVTLYYEQWCRLFDAAEEIAEFLEANKDALKLKSAAEVSSEKESGRRSKQTQQTSRT